MQKNEIEVPAAVKLTVGKHWQQRLPGQGAAGYQWFHEIEGPNNLVEISITPITPPMRPASGGEPPDAGSFDECLDILPLRPGAITLHLSQKRSWELDKAPLRQYQINITIRDH